MLHFARTAVLALPPSRFLPAARCRENRRLSTTPGGYNGSPTEKHGWPFSPRPFSPFESSTPSPAAAFSPFLTAKRQSYPSTASTMLKPAEGNFESCLLPFDSADVMIRELRAGRNPLASERTDRRGTEMRCKRDRS